LHGSALQRRAPCANMAYHVLQTAKLQRTVKLLLLVELAGIAAGSQIFDRTVHSGRRVVRAGLGNEESVQARLSSSQDVGQQQQSLSAARVSHTGLLRRSALDHNSTLLRPRQLPPRNRAKAVVDAAFRRAFESDFSPQTLLEQDPGSGVPLTKPTAYPAQLGAHADDPDDPTKSIGCSDNEMGKYICKMLYGPNLQVMKRLENVIQSMNIMEPGAEEVEMAMKDQDEHLHGLRDNLWTLMFCAKRAQINTEMDASGAPRTDQGSCDPKTSDEPEVKAARESAVKHLQALAEEEDEEKSIGNQVALKALGDLAQSGL